MRSVFRSTKSQHELSQFLPKFKLPLAIIHPLANHIVLYENFSQSGAAVSVPFQFYNWVCLESFSTKGFKTLNKY